MKSQMVEGYVTADKPAFPVLNGRQVMAFGSALSRAYTLAEMREFLRTRLERRYEELAPSGATYDAALFAIIGNANRFRWADALLREARGCKPHNSDLLSFEESLQLRSSPSDRLKGEPSAYNADSEL
jgi:Effector-associated domain 1